MRYYPSSLLESASWYSFNDTYVERSKWYLPRLSDPSILLPSESPDGKWHLFCHTWLGIHHYVSFSGLNWEDTGKVLFLRSHSPFIYREGGRYYMLFERHSLNKKEKDVTKNASRIFISSSDDLFSWSEEKVILDSTRISASSYRMGPCRVSRPQLISWQGKFILYFGALSTITPPVALSTFAAAGIAESSVWKTGVEAVKLACTGFVIPFIFVYNNELLWTGNAGAIIWAFVTAMIGCAVVSFSLTGWMKTKLSVVGRILLFPAGVMLFCAHPVWLNFLGVAIAAAVLVVENIISKKKNNVVEVN